jgi:hypothetical protein
MADIEENKSSSESSVPKIRTFQTDAQHYIKDKNLSPVQMAARSYTSQQRQGGPIAPPTAPMTWQKKLLFGGGGVVALLLIGGGYMFFTTRSTPPPPQNTGPHIPAPLVFAETQIVLEVKQGDANALQKQIIVEREKSRGTGSLEYLPILVIASNAKPVLASPTALVNLLGWDAPDSFVEQIKSPANMFIYFGPQDHDMVFVFTINNFERALASLFGWEKSLPRTLKSYLLNAPDDLVSHPVFEDEIIKNHNARILKTGDNRTILGYAIFNKKYVIIATSRDALATVLGRFVALPPQ